MLVRQVLWYASMLVCWYASMKGGTHAMRERMLYQNEKGVTMEKKCGCGCGETVKPGNSFVWGHNTKPVKKKGATDVQQDASIPAKASGISPTGA